MAPGSNAPVLTHAIAITTIMKTLVAILIAAGLGVAVAAVVVTRQQTALRSAQAAESAQREAALAAEKAGLEKALAAARRRPAAPVEAAAPTPAPVVELAKAFPPTECIQRLVALKVSPGPGQAQTMRQVVHELESLIAAGPLALPAIKEFLARNEDIDYEPAAGGKRSSFDPRNGTEFVTPPSLRFGLLDALRRIGGADAEKLMAEVLGTTGRGSEVLYLARVLQDMVPNKYRDLSVTVARDLLTNPIAKTGGPADPLDKEYLFGVLSFYRDASFATQAQAQLVSADGKVDRTAMKYLLTTLGEQTLAIAQQTWNDPRITADQKEPLARVALTYLGSNPQAEPLYKTAINDLSLPKDHRRELIEDLNTDGFANKRNPTPADVTLIQNRLQFIQQHAPNAADVVNAKAFAEAHKDLLQMLNKANAGAQPKP